MRQFHESTAHIPFERTESLRSALALSDKHSKALVLLAVALSYYVGAQAAFFVGTLSDKIFAPFWPPNIILFAALAYSRPATWWTYLLAVFPAHLIAELGIGMPVFQMLVAFATNCAIAMFNASIARLVLGTPPRITGLSDTTLMILLIGIIGPAIFALGGAFVPIADGGSFEKYGIYWFQWFMSNALGGLTLVPIILLALGGQLGSITRANRRRYLESIFVSVLLVAACIVACDLGAARLPASFLPAVFCVPLPFVLWMAYRYGLNGASAAILIVSVVLIWRTLNGTSPFASSDTDMNVFALQLFIVGISIPILMLGASADERVTFVRSLRESDARVMFSTSAARIALWQLDVQTGKIWMTDNGPRMLGLGMRRPITLDRLLGSIHEEDISALSAAVQETSQNGNLAICDFRVIQNGKVRWFRARAKAHRKLFYPKERGRREVSGTFADITDRKRVEAEVAQQRQELAHLTRVAMASELSGSIAHELTQPLAAILANAESAKLILEANPKDIAELEATLEDIISDGNRAGEVIHRLRGLLKKDDGSFEIVDVNEIVESTIKLVTNELINKRVEVSLSLFDQLPLVSGDPVQLQQVVLNLLLNAMDALSEVSAENRLVSVSTILSDGEAEIRVSDCGIGLSHTEGEDVFKPFVTTKRRGLGLGLSLSKSIIKHHGGSLALQNNSESGATATVRLPVLESLKVSA